MTIEDYDEIEDQLDQMVRDAEGPSVEGVERWLRDHGLSDEADALKDAVKDGLIEGEVTTELKEPDDVFPGEDQGEIEADLHEALELIGNIYNWFQLALDEDLFREALNKYDPTIVSEARKLMAQTGRYLDNWEWEG